MLRSSLTLSLVLLTTSLSHASVVNSNASGFTIKHAFDVNKAPDAVYQAFVEKIQEWWDPEHTYSGKSQNLSIDLKPDGCFCERLGAQGFVVHMSVIYADPGKLLRLTGGLGPLQQYAATGVMSVEFKPQANGTSINVTYAVGGYIAGGADKLAQAVDAVLVGQMNRFERYVKTGAP